MTEHQITLHGFVSGRVQGVFFRAETRDQAVALGLDGWVRNLPDGRVEVLFGGDHAAVEAMCVWLRGGPPRARVDHLELDETNAAAGSGFRITS